jgi:hypothetical protein
LSISSFIAKVASQLDEKPPALSGTIPLIINRFNSLLPFFLCSQSQLASPSRVYLACASREVAIGADSPHTMTATETKPLATQPPHWEEDVALKKNKKQLPDWHYEVG